MYKTPVIVLFSIVIASAVFLLLGLSDCVFNELYISFDSYSYMEASNMLYNELKPHPTRPLTYAFILGLINFIWENPNNFQYTSFSLFINLASWIGSIIILHKSLLLYFNKKAAFWLTLFSIVSLGSIAQNFLLLTESITTFILSLIAFYILKYSLFKKNKYLIISVSLLNFLVLIRPGFLYLAIIASLMLIVFAIIKRQKWNVLIIAFVFSILLISFQYVLMYKTYDKATISFIDKITWYNYLGAESFANASNTPLPEVREVRETQLKNKTYKEMSKIASEDLIYQIKNNPTEIIQEALSNLVENSISGSHAITGTREIHKTSKTNYSFIVDILFFISRVQNLFYISLLIISLVFLVKNLFRTNISIYFLFAIVSYIILTSSISFWQGDRFHIVTYQTILIIFVSLIKNKNYAKKWLKE